jgi:hypothetical protein
VSLQKQYDVLVRLDIGDALNPGPAADVGKLGI